MTRSVNLSFPEGLCSNYCICGSCFTLAFGRAGWYCVTILFFFNIYVYVWMFFLHISVNICTPGIQRGHEGVLGALELDLCLVVHYHVGSGNQTRVLCKSSKCSESLVVMKMRSSGLGCTGDAWPPTAKSIWIWKLMKRMYIKCDSVLSPIHGISMWGGLASASFDNTVKLYQEDFTG